jgi:hypothetical protein
MEITQRSIPADSPQYGGFDLLKKEKFSRKIDGKLAKALAGGDMLRVQSLVGKGANINALSEGGKNMYWWGGLSLYWDQSSKCMEYLARSGVKLQEGCLEFIIRYSQNEPYFTPYLIEAGGDYSLIGEEDFKGPVSIKGFISSGVSPNHVYPSGTSLLQAVLNSKLEPRELSPHSPAAWKVAEDVALYLDAGGNSESTIEYKDGNISVEEWVNEFTRDRTLDSPVAQELMSAVEKSIRSTLESEAEVANINVEEQWRELMGDARQDSPVNKRLREALEKSKKANRPLE